MHDAKFVHQGWGDTGSVENPSRVVDRRLALMVRTGLRAAEMAWALEISINEIEAQLKTLSVQLGGDHRAVSSVSDKTPDVLPGSVHPARPPLLDHAIAALGDRIVLFKGEIHLDGRPANFRDLVVAAAAEGIKIHYPGLQPLPAAFHTGPSKSVARRRPKAPPSLMSIHVPY
ncbi:MAG: hypothetical protein HQ514_01275 [Rhodospirillales bacterium]|nr:hypothetical protein [Rhodospirillales bacterium]